MVFTRFKSGLAGAFTSVGALDAEAKELTSLTMEELVARKRLEGFAPVHWVVHPKGVRAEATGPAKVGVPSEYSKARVCVLHGNLVKLRHETCPERSDRGLRILDVLPCVFCTPDPVKAILRFPKTR